MTPPPLRLWPAALQDRYNERAAIKEYEGGLTREQAEAQAFSEVWEAWVAERKKG